LTGDLAKVIAHNLSLMHNDAGVGCVSAEDGTPIFGTPDGPDSDPLQVLEGGRITPKDVKRLLWEQRDNALLNDLEGVRVWSVYDGDLGSTAIGIYRVGPVGSRRSSEAEQVNG